MSITFAEKLASIPGYQPGVPKGKAPEAIADSQIAQLASNESPFPPHPAVVEAIAKAAAASNRYPDPDATLLRRRISERFEVDSPQIAVSNGSCELLLAAALALCEPGAEILYAWPSFSMYQYLAPVSGAREIRVSVDGRAEHDLDAMLSEITAATQIVLLCNPNNPTGTHIPAERIGAFLERVPPHVTVILDEAYAEFQTHDDPDAGADLRRDFPNLVVLRTFSKAYGLAGLRVGYALCAPAFRSAVDAVRQPFSVNALAQAAGAEAILHSDDVAKRVESTVVERVTVEEGVRELGPRTPDSHANFSWVHLGDADEAEVVEGARRGGHRRPAGHAAGRPGPHPRHVRDVAGEPALPRRPRPPGLAAGFLDRRPKRAYPGFMARGTIGGVLALTVACAIAALTGASAHADVTLGTTGPLTYISDESAPVVPPGQTGPVTAQCPAGTNVVGGGARIPGFGADAHLNAFWPNTTEGPRGGFGVYMWNQSGPNKTAISHATCLDGPKAKLRSREGETESAPDAVALKARCKGSEHVSGGGAYVNGLVDEAFVNSSHPIDGGDPGGAPDDGWRVRVQNRAGFGKGVTAWALCTERDWSYHRSNVQLMTNQDAGYLMDCLGEPGHLVSAGAKITGAAGETVLRALSPYDGGDGDGAPDDGADINTANDGGERTLTRFAICT